MHPQVATDLNSLATLSFHIGERHLARQLYARALSIRQATLVQPLAPRPSSHACARSVLTFGVLTFGADWRVRLVRLAGAQGETHPRTLASLKNLKLVEAQIAEADSAAE